MDVMDVSSFWKLCADFLSVLSLPYLGKPMRVFLLNFFDLVPGHLY